MAGELTCPTCEADPKAAPSRYCAPLRCLCGHQACHAFASWRPPRSLANVQPFRPRRPNRKRPTDAP